MKKGISILFLILFAYTQLYNAWVWAHYQLNVDEITELFCENTDNPELNCNGKCHFKEMLLSDNENRDQESPVYLSETQLFQAPPLFDETTKVSGLNANKLPEYINQYSFSPVFELLQPPRS